MGDQRLELRAEEQAIGEGSGARPAGLFEPGTASPESEIERLLAQSVPRKHQLFLRCIPDRQGEHAVDSLGKRLAPLQIGAKHHLGVASRGEMVTARLQRTL